MDRDAAPSRAVAPASVAFYAAFFSPVLHAGVIAASLGHCAFNLVWPGSCPHAFRQRNAAAPFRRD